MLNAGRMPEEKRGAPGSGELSYAQAGKWFYWEPQALVYCERSPHSSHVLSTSSPHLDPRPASLPTTSIHLNAGE